MATLRDIARQAGVSVTTASRALNNYDDVAELTRTRVQQVAASLDYHPNVAAQRLQNDRTNAIGLIIPLILHRFHDPFWFDFIGGMASACAERGTDLLVSPADGGAGADLHFLRLVRGRRVDGLLLCDVRRSDPRIGVLQRHKIPFVAFGRSMDDQSYPFIDVDGEAGVAEAVRHLIGLGHRRIAYLGLSPDLGFSHFRLTGYTKALVRAGLHYDPHLVREGLTESSVESVVRDLLDWEEPPTAIFAAADFLAIAALSVARDRGLSVPANLSIATFDDGPIVQHADPPLTAVGQPNRRLGEEAAELLIDRVSSPHAPITQRLVVPAMVMRASTAAPRATT